MATKKKENDIAVIAETIEGLQEMINGLERYITRNNLEIYTQKPQIMVFCRGGRISKNEFWTHHGQPLTVAKKYKHLGYIFTPTNVLFEHVLLRATKAQDVIYCIASLIRRMELNDMNDKLSLFSFLVQSVLLYGVEIWGLARQEAAEKVYRRYMKMSLQISRNCPDYIWLTELAMHELKITTMKRIFKYVTDIANMEDHRWPKICLRVLVSEEVQKSQWRQDPDRVIPDAGSMLTRQIWDGDNGEQLKTTCEQILASHLEQGIQHRWSKIDKSSCNVGYKLLKQIYGREEYPFYNTKTINQRRCWAQLRCETLERAAKLWMPSIQRRCRLCKDSDETLLHFFSCHEMNDFKRVHNLSRANTIDTED